MSLEPSQTTRSESLGGRLRHMAATGSVRFKAWCRDDGYWYLNSVAAHAVGLICLALISVAVPTAILSSPEKAPSFDEVKQDASSELPPPERFDLGDSPLEPTKLSPETLAQMKDLPIKGQTEKYYDDSLEFEESNKGASDQTGLHIPGLGLRDISNPLGPGGADGVGPGMGESGGGFAQRNRGHRSGIPGNGTTEATERAVGAAVNWLYRHQSPQGKWSLDFRRQCKGGACSGPGGIQSDTAATSLAILPFLAAGQTHKSPKGLYQPCVAKGLAWLVKQQKPDGNLAGDAPQPMYSHGLATLTLCEAFGMSRDEHLGAAARKAVAYIERAQNQSTGGWRYEPGEAGDTSVFGWQIMALKSAQLAGLSVNSQVFENAEKWLRSVAKGEHNGLYSYQPYREVTPTMTAVGMLCRQYLGINPKDPAMLEGKASLLENLPDGKLLRNAYYWYYGTLAMHNFMDSDWDAWNRRMRRVLIESQERRGCAMGSWDPEKPTADIWGPQGGRLMVTSLNCLTLEVYYRYLPLFKTDSLVPGRSSRMGFKKPIDAKEEE